MMSAAQPPVFQTLIVPHRSLTRKGMWVLISTMVILTAAVALRIWLMGAWPVVAFSFIEVPLLIVLLAVNHRRARTSECILLDASQLTVIRTDPSGRRQQESLSSPWLRASLNSTTGSSRLILTSHGRECEVGSFLHEPEKHALFDALEAALHHLKNPNFDNPQLSDGA